MSTELAAAPVIEEVVGEVGAWVHPAERELAERFARLFFTRARPEFFRGLGVRALAGIAAGNFRHLQESRPDRVDVEVVNPEADGTPGAVTVVRTNVGERPFIVDTIREYLNARDLSIERFLHPVLRVVRNDAGRIVELGPAGAGDPRESLVYCELERVSRPDERELIRSALQANLEDTVRATDDYRPMLGALDAAAAELAACAGRFPDRRAEIEEAGQFLCWLREGEFVFLGYRGYDIVDTADGGRAIRVEPGSGLGILRDESRSSFAMPVPLEELPPGLRDRIAGGPLLIISKTNALSPVHRRARMDYIGIRKLDARGRIAGERRFIGLFTSRAYAEDAGHIPILREKLRAILDDAGAMEGSYDYKEIITIFNSMPKEELFPTSADEIGRQIQAALALYHTREVRVTLRTDPLGRGVSLMVVLPKDRFSGVARRRLEQALVDRYHGTILNYHLAMGGGEQARLHFFLAAPPERLAAIDAADVEQLVREITRSWADLLRAELEKELPADDARSLAHRFAAAFGPEYRAVTRPATAARDLRELISLETANRSIALRFSPPDDDSPVPCTRLTVYLRGERMVLSDFMPILESCGLRVLAMNPFPVARPDLPPSSINDFMVQAPGGGPIDLDTHGQRLAATILAIHDGVAANDSLNALVLTAGLAWREVDILRALAEYAFQLGLVPARLALPTALLACPAAAALLVRLFHVRFDPATTLSLDERAAAADRIQAEFSRALETVTSLADDRALRRLLGLVLATVRANYFRHGGAHPSFTSGGVPFISFKFSGERLRAIARTRLLFEVWVQSSRMAGVHLRGAAVARGGIRHSDRPDDFRTEILGLVRTQGVKNAVIIPAGSKGGFVVRRQLTDPAAMREEVADQYRTLIRGLLDLTDNLVEGEIRTPEGVVCWDGPDPYLVVAADKGTARFSDVANAISADYGFWLGDAFASGGSHGYDHKAVGITARGAWECVRRHFRELGRDIQEEPFTVVGIGDMSGDVFGNGMLLSRRIRLIAAFDHRHIFVDPDPDPERSFAERRRLFELGRSSWDDYDRSLLSPGGFIVPRGIKQVDVPAAARTVLGLPADASPLDGEALVRAILQAPADLLWNGGIGTYVRASDESDADVGDPANDAVRIDATALRVKVVGEGGNLGLTQRARVQAALCGVRLDTDAVHNSGGVDMSDREVNLKILLGGATAAGTLATEARNELLRRITPDVTERVLADNRSQSLAISLDHARAGDDAEDWHRLMLALERERLLDRADEALPSFETLAERRQRGATITRPELAVLLAYAKLSLKAHLLASPLPDDPAAHDYLAGYFPADARAAAGERPLRGHRLRREIVASQLANDLVDLMGAAFVHRSARETGRSPADVARAWLIAARLADAGSLRRSLAELEGSIPTAVVYRWLLDLARVLDRATGWVLANTAPDAPATTIIAEHTEGLALLRDRFDDIVAGEERALFDERVAEMRGLTPRHDLAQRLITLRFLDQLLEILRLARETATPPLRAGRAYFLAAELLRAPWLRRALFDAAGEDRWEQREARALADDLARAHRTLASLALTQGTGAEPAEELLRRTRERWSRELDALATLLDEIRATDRPPLAALAAAIRELLLLRATA